MKYTKQQVEEAKISLLECLKPGDKVYTILRQVSRSGMSRHISVVLVNRTKPGEVAERDNGSIRDITYLVARVLGERINHDDGGLVVSGCGMDMGFEVVYNLGFRLWPNGFACIGENCPSNDHYNGMPRTMQYTPDTCPGKPCGSGCDHVGISQSHHTDGGYALRQGWI